MILFKLVVNSFLERFLVVFGFRQCSVVWFHIHVNILHDPVRNGIFIVHRNAWTFSFKISLLVESLHEMLKQVTLYFNTTKYIIDALQGSGLWHVWEIQDDCDVQ